MFRDREYLSGLFSLALPMTLQYFVSASLNMLGGLMIGQLGEAALAAVGLANQVTFLLTLMLFGISSGTAVFTAQLWGAQDVSNIRRVLGLSLALAVTGALGFGTAAVLFPGAVLSLYSRDPAVVALGSSYLRIMGLSYLGMAITYSFASVLRCTGNVRLPLVVSLCALSLNTVISYLLIFGHLGLPALGINGAAIGTVLARLLECGLLVWLAYRFGTAAAGSARELFSGDRPFARTVLGRAFPVILGEMLWSVGITLYNAIYARIGTEAIAAVNIVVTIENVAFVAFLGVADATAILVGNQIGAGRLRTAERYAGWSLALVTAGAIGMGGLIAVGAGQLLALYKVSPLVTAYAQRLFLVVAATLWFRVSNMVLIVGIMRSGGDTRFAFVLDVGTVWLVGVPLALLGAFVLHWPVYYVYLLIMVEEVVKWGIGLARYFSKKWINELAPTL